MKKLWKVLAGKSRHQVLWLRDRKVGSFQGRAIKIGRLAFVRWAS